MNIKEIFVRMEYGKAPEDREVAELWYGGHHDTLLHYINGEWQEPASGKYFETSNPACNEVLARVADGNAEDANRAVAAAVAAAPAWAALGGHERARYLYAIARQVQKHSRLLAVLESLDNGKPIRESRDIDIPLVARHFYYHAGWAQVMEREMPGFEPLGVVGQIIPWNFPLLMAAWKVAPALAMGNTVVLKPAEFTSSTAVLLAQICDEVGLPDGVFNLLLGDGKAGAALVEHKDVKKIAFTGSTEVGRILRKATAGTGKKLTLELGGKSPFIVYEDADLDSVVEGLVDAIWFNQGQVCCAGSRLLVQESIAETLLAKVKLRMSKLVIGDPLDKSIDIGAVVDPVQLQTITDLVKLGAEEGGHVWQAEPILPEKRLLLSTHTDHRCAAIIDTGAGRDFRPGTGIDDLQNPGRGDRTRQQHPLWPGGQRLDREHQPRAGCCAQTQGRFRVDQLHQCIRCGGRLRRLPRIRFWP